MALSASEWVDGLLYGLVALGLTISSILARIREPAWYGAAVAGWAWFLLGAGPWFTHVEVPDALAHRNLNGDLLPARWIGAACDRRIAAREPDGLRLDVLNEVETRRATAAGIAHLLLTPALAGLGALASAARAGTDRSGRRPIAARRAPRPLRWAILAGLAIPTVWYPAFRDGSEFGVRLAAGWTAALLVLAALRARDGRPFWHGAAVAGSAWFLLAHGAWFAHRADVIPPNPRDEIRRSDNPRLPPARWVAEA